MFEGLNIIFAIAEDDGMKKDQPRGSKKGTSVVDPIYRFTEDGYPFLDKPT